MSADSLEEASAVSAAALADSSAETLTSNDASAEALTETSVDTFALSETSAESLTDASASMLP